MPRQPIRTLDVRTRAAWRAWLERSHAKVAEIWVVFHKQHTGIAAVEHEAAVEEALCFGWIDSLVRRLDADRYAIKFTQRKPDSAWSDINRRRYAAIEARGLLAPAGRARAPTGRRPEPPPPRRTFAKTPPYIERAFKAERRAWVAFAALTAAERRRYLVWIDTAKREDTKARRLAEAVRLLTAGEKLGLK
ncbi:MAG: YdeI/OmpD-associated family protein [Gammaproteobacteria bacterium]